MPVYGIGAMYGTEDKSKDFYNSGVACVGWSKDEAPAVHEQFKSLCIGDIVFLKSFSPTNGLYIKAVGVVTDSNFRKITTNLGFGVDVQWSWQGMKKIGKLEDRCDYARRGSFYIEYNPDLLRQIIDLLNGSNE